MRTLGRFAGLALVLGLPGWAPAAETLPYTQRFAVDDAALAAAVEVVPQDLDALLQADEGRRRADPLAVGAILAVPKGFGLAAGKAGAGAVYALGEDRRLWRSVVRAPGALFLELDFSDLRLPDGAELYAYDPARSMLRGPVTAADLDATPRHRLPFVVGDTAILEISAPAARFDAVRAELGSLAWGYRDFAGNAADKRSAAAKSDACHVDVACDQQQVLADQVDSVGQLTYVAPSRTNGQLTLQVCSGQLIANTRRDATPLFLTANHCIGSQDVADSVVVYWNYESPVCRTPGSASSGVPLPRIVASHVQSGAILLSTYAPSDFTLLLLSRPVPRGANLYFSGWDRRSIVPAESFSIHHPNGHEKRLSYDGDPAVISAYVERPEITNSHLRIVSWDYGITAGGSSGGGLWDGRTGLLLGQLHGGESECDNDGSDYYGRLFVSWFGGGSRSSRLADWLDPTGSGATQFAGYRANAVAPSVVTRNPGVARPDWDFDANGTSDYLWYNPATGTTVSWANSWDAQGELQTQLLQHPQWRVVTSGDFNADGRSDLIWYNPATGETYYWLLRGNTIVDEGTLLTAAGWRVTHSADVDANGRDDLLWYNPNTGETFLWQIGEGSIVQTSLLRHPSWRIVATTDLNGDYRGDLIWYNPATGETFYWMMNGAGPVQAGSLLIHPSWRVVAAGDLDGNGRGDLLWHNPATGESFGWLMDGNGIVDLESLLVHPHWRITATGDFNNDGKDDLLWYNPATGETYRWFMNGLDPIEGESVFTHPHWRIVNQ